MGMPKLEFIELEDKTEEGLDKFFDDYGEHSSNFLVYLRQKYTFPGADDWEYLIVHGSFDYEHYVKIPTFVLDWDWNEGQERVEYLGVCPIP